MFVKEADTLPITRVFENDAGGVTILTFDLLEIEKEYFEPGIAMFPKSDIHGVINTLQKILAEHTASQL